MAARRPARQRMDGVGLVLGGAGTEIESAVEAASDMVSRFLFRD